MKPIKFRSWISSIQEFVYFENGIYSKVSKDGVPVFNWENAEQFMGLEDGNKNPIYENDILDFDYKKYPDDTPCPYKVVFHDGGFCGEPLDKKYDFKNRLSAFELSVLNDKIIGNIHQNPDLI